MTKRVANLEAGLIGEAAEIPLPKLVDLSVVNRHLGSYYKSSALGLQVDALDNHRNLLQVFQLISGNDFLFDENARKYFERASVLLRRNAMKIKRRLIQPLSKRTDNCAVGVARDFRFLHRQALDTVNHRHRFKDHIIRTSPAETSYDPALVPYRERLETAVLDILGGNEIESRNTAAVVTTGLISRAPMIVLSFDPRLPDLLKRISSEITDMAKTYQFRRPTFVPGAITLGGSPSEPFVKTPAFYVPESRYL